MHRYVLIWPIITLIASTVCASAYAAQCSPKRPPLTEFGYHYKIGKRLTPQVSETNIRLERAGDAIRFVRMLIRPSVIVPGWKIIVRDQQYRPLQVISATNFPAGSKTVWTHRFPVSFVFVELVMDREIPDFLVDIPAANAMPEKAKSPWYSTKSADPDWSDLYGRSFGEISVPLRKSGEAIGMLTSFTGSAIAGVRTWCCSGSLIATEPRILFLTNFHCGGLPTWTQERFWQGDICENTIIDFSWDGDAVSSEFACKEVVKVSPELDAVVLELFPLSGNDISATPVRIRSESVEPSENLRIIHHPLCSQKKISQGCSVGDRQPNWKDESVVSDFAHVCDTEGGSSGAPMLDNEGRLVGLHHLGHQLDDSDNCDRLNKAVDAQYLKEFLDKLPITFD